VRTQRIGATLLDNGDVLAVHHTIDPRHLSSRSSNRASKSSKCSLALALALCRAKEFDTRFVHLSPEYRAIDNFNPQRRFGKRNNLTKVWNTRTCRPSKLTLKLPSWVAKKFNNINVMPAPGQGPQGPRGPVDHISKSLDVLAVAT